jgi:hypothetical protein
VVAHVADVVCVDPSFEPTASQAESVRPTCGASTVARSRADGHFGDNIPRATILIPAP